MSTAVENVNHSHGNKNYFSMTIRCRGAGQIRHLGRTQLKACSGLLHHPILSSHLISRLWRHWHTGRVPLPDIFIRGGRSETGTPSLLSFSARGVTAGTPLALLGRLPCPGKPCHGEGGSGSQPEELSCGRALAPTTRRIPAPSCESNWHSTCCRYRHRLFQNSCGPHTDSPLPITSAANQLAARFTAQCFPPWGMRLEKRGAKALPLAFSRAFTAASRRPFEKYSAVARDSFSALSKHSGSCVALHSRSPSQD
ncbi:unnamed protein product [Leuciscus chuanchicus]